MLTNTHTPMEQKFKTIQQTSDDTVVYDGKVYYTRKGYMNIMKLSENSLGSPYFHVKSGKAEQFNFFSTSFFRPI